LGEKEVFVAPLQGIESALYYLDKEFMKDDFYKSLKDRFFVGNGAGDYTPILRVRLVRALLEKGLVRREEISESAEDLESRLLKARGNGFSEDASGILVKASLEYFKRFSAKMPSESRVRKWLNGSVVMPNDWDFLDADEELMRLKGHRKDYGILMNIRRHVRRILEMPKEKRDAHIKELQERKGSYSEEDVQYWVIKAAERLDYLSGKAAYCYLQVQAVDKTGVGLKQHRPELAKLPEIEVTKEFADQSDISEKLGIYIKNPRSLWNDGIVIDGAFFDGMRFYVENLAMAHGIRPEDIKGINCVMSLVRRKTIKKAFVEVEMDGYMEKKLGHLDYGKNADESKYVAFADEVYNNVISGELDRFLGNGHGTAARAIGYIDAIRRKFPKPFLNVWAYKYLMDEAGLTGSPKRDIKNIRKLYDIARQNCKKDGHELPDKGRAHIRDFKYGEVLSILKQYGLECYAFYANAGIDGIEGGKRLPNGGGRTLVIDVPLEPLDFGILKVHMPESPFQSALYRKE